MLRQNNLNLTFLCGHRTRRFLPHTASNALNLTNPQGEPVMTDYRTQKDAEITTHTEQAAFDPLTIVNLHAEAQAIDQIYKNFVLLNVNNHCVRMAVMQGDYRWHHHPHSD